jgi:hypothetical protein
MSKSVNSKKPKHAKKLKRTLSWLSGSKREAFEIDTDLDHLTAQVSD